VPAAEQVLVATRISQWVLERVARQHAGRDTTRRVHGDVGRDRGSRALGSSDLAVAGSAGPPVEEAARSPSRRDRTRVTATLASVHGRAVNLRLDPGGLVSVCANEVALSPNGIAVELSPRDHFTDLQIRAGQRALLDAGELRVPAAGLRVCLSGAACWVPRPAIGRVSFVDLARRLAEAMAVTSAEAAPGSLVPLLWASDRYPPSTEPAREASRPAAALGRAATARDAAGVAAAARGLAGLGPGLTPSGDDFLAGFAAAWALVPTSLGHPARSGDSLHPATLLAGEALATALARRGVRIPGPGPGDGKRSATHPAPRRRAPGDRGRIRWRSVSDQILDPLCAGAASGASELGRAWITHAARGEVAEPLGRFFFSLTETRRGPAPVDYSALTASVRAVLTIGATSGADWMTGVLCGVASILGALRADVVE
jgi:hypothetical protein